MKRYDLYIEDNPGYRMLLLTDGKSWWKTTGDANGYFMGFDLYDGSLDEVAGMIGQLFATGEIETDDFDAGSFDPIPDYDGLTLDDIDNIVNYENGIPKNHDLTEWQGVWTWSL